MNDWKDESSGSHGSKSDFELLLTGARDGSREALGKLIEGYRDYLLLVANEGLDPQLRKKLGASDIVQETLLAVQEEFLEFRGGTEQEWLAWLKAILHHDLWEEARKYRSTQKRQIDREVRLDDAPQSDSAIWDLPSPSRSPISHAAMNEESEILAQALRRLPDDYRRVIQLRNWEERSFAEIAEQFGRSSEAVRKLWTRAILRLQSELEAVRQDGDETTG